MVQNEKCKMKWYHWTGIGLGVLTLGGFFNRERVMSNLKQIKLGEFFTLDEFVKTRTGFDNTPTPEAIERLRLLVKYILDPLRKAVGKPITITSGYRSPTVNSNVVGSSKTSQHMKGEAADFKISGMTNQQVIDLVRKLRLPYDQIIDEQRGSSLWVHISYNSNGNQRAQWMTRRDPGPTRTREYELIKTGLA